MKEPTSGNYNFMAFYNIQKSKHENQEGYLKYLPGSILLYHFRMSQNVEIQCQAKLTDMTNDNEFEEIVRVLLVT